MESGSTDTVGYCKMVETATTIHVGEKMLRRLLYIDVAGKEHLLPVPPREQLDATLAILRYAGRGAQVILQRGNDKRSRIGLDEEDYYD